MTGGALIGALSQPLVLIGLWVVLAFVMAAVPSTDNHWRRAYILIGVGLPIIVWITLNNGILMGALGFIIGGLVLRWPVYFLWQWIKRKTGRA